MVAAGDLKSLVFGRAGSTPVVGIYLIKTVYLRVRASLPILNKEKEMKEIKFRAFLFGSMKYFDTPESLQHFSGGTSGPTRRLSECGLMQYIGFKDTHGTEIYENDIIEIVDSNGRVVYIRIEYSKHDGAIIGTNPRYYYPYELYELFRTEDSRLVVGNIYENLNYLEKTL